VRNLVSIFDTSRSLAALISKCIYQHQSNAFGAAIMELSAFHPFGVDKWVVSCNRMSGLVAPSGECLWGEGLV